MSLNFIAIVWPKKKKNSPKKVRWLTALSSSSHKYQNCFALWLELWWVWFLRILYTWPRLHIQQSVTCVTVGDVIQILYGLYMALQMFNYCTTTVQILPLLHHLQPCRRQHPILKIPHLLTTGVLRRAFSLGQQELQIHYPWCGMHAQQYGLFKRT